MHEWLTTELVVGTLFVTSFATVGLLALWAATSPRHWFIRTSILIAALSLLLVVPAYEPFLMFALESAVIVGGVKLWQWLPKSDRSRRSVHFSLRSLLLVTPIVAVVTAIGTHLAVHMLPQTMGAWRTILLNGVASGLVVLLAAWISVSTNRKVVLLISAGSCLGLAAALAWYDWLVPTFTEAIDFGWPPDPNNFASATGGLDPFPQLIWFAILPAIMLLVLLVVTLCLTPFALAATSASRPRLNSRPSSRLASAALTLLLMLIAAFPFYVLWQLFHPIPPPTFVMPNPNGFDEIKAAAAEFDSSPILTTLTPAQSIAQLAAEVAKYASSYERLRAGLAQDIRARDWPQPGNRWSKFKWRDDPVQGVRRQAARPLLVEAELAQQQQRHADAARISQDIIRLGYSTSRDGTVVDYLVGIALEGVAHQALYPAVKHLTPDECRASIKLLIDLDLAREPFEHVLERDRVWSHNALGWHGHLWQILEDISPSSKSNDAVQQVRRRNQALKRLLIVELAIRAFQVEHGTVPNALDDLTPELREELFVDPFDPEGQRFRYARTGDSYLLYSVGNDGQDNQGRATGRTAGISNDDQDLRLDVFCAPDPPLPATSAGDPDTIEKESVPVDEQKKLDNPQRK